MNRRFELHTTKDDWRIIKLEYDKDKLLCGLQFEGNYGNEHFNSVAKWCQTINKLRSLAKKLNYPLVEIDAPTPSFEEFWEAYGLKKDKKKAELRWNKLNPDSKVRSVQYIEKYNNDLVRNGFAKKMAKTYLNDECWNDEK